MQYKSYHFTSEFFVVVVLYCLQGPHSLDSANQVEVFTESSVCPQA